MNEKMEVERSVIKKMKDMGTYKVEFSDIISIFASMLHQYKTFEKEFEASGYQITEEHTNKVGATNSRKVPLYTAMESLRKDLAVYSDRLALNPRAVDKITVESVAKSRLSEVLDDLAQRE